jgi:cytochrome c5
MKKTILSISIIAVLFACATPKESTTSTENKVVLSDLEMGQKLYPGYTQANFDDGKNLYDSKCAACHAAKAPSSKSPNEWKSIVPSMSELSNKKSKPISADEELLITKYLVTVSSK